MTYYQSLEDPYGDVGRKQSVQIPLRTLQSQIPRAFYYCRIGFHEILLQANPVLASRMA